MNKKLLIIVPVILLLIVIIIVFGIKKGGSLQLKGSDAQTASSLVNQAKDFEAKNNLVEAKAAYQKLLSGFPNSSEVMNWEKKIEDMNIKLLFSSTETPGSALYEIKPGDTLTKIAREFKTTIDLIMKSNNISDGKILPGKKIKVWNAPFTILIDKSQNTLILKTNEEIIKTYIVSTGTNNSTPVGTFKITDKLPNPTWFKAGAIVPAGSSENVLGTRWLGFDLPGYGIHGTTDPQSLGKQVTQGCVRMANSDVEELYSIVPSGTEVTIVD